MGCTGSNAMDTQATCANEYEEMLKEARAVKAGQGVGDLNSMPADLAGGIARNWKLNNSPKNPKDAKNAGPSSPVIMEDSSKYLGSWKDGKKHGKGKQLFKDGTVFEGIWQDGHAEGYGTLEVGGTALDGTHPPKFEGMIKHSMADGPGTFTYSDGSIIKGHWVKDEKNGFFQEVWSDGTKFKGYYVDGKKEGFGFQIWPDKSSYYGEFQNDAIAGWGRYQWNDGRAVRAQWVQNLMNGYGHFVWEDGRVYKGEYSEGKKEGYGEFCWPDGRNSKGYWKNSQLHGLNYMTNLKGQSKWMLYNNGQRERPVDSSDERNKIWKAEGQVQNPKLPSLPVWLSKLPAEATTEETVDEDFDAFVDTSSGVDQAKEPAQSKDKKDKKDKKEKKEKKEKKDKTEKAEAAETEE